MIFSQLATRGGGWQFSLVHPSLSSFPFQLLPDKGQQHSALPPSTILFPSPANYAGSSTLCTVSLSNVKHAVFYQ